MSNKWYYSLLIFVFISLSSTTQINASSLLLNEIAGLETNYSKDLQSPNPLQLHPQWWEYFNVKEEDVLRQRIELTNRNLQELYSTLPFEDQSTAVALINKISVTLNALPFARKQNTDSFIASKPFLKNYTFEQQIELTHQIRKLKNDLQQEKASVALSKERLAKAHKDIDNLLVAYLGNTQPSSKKFLSGLEIIAFRGNIGLGEENVRLSEHRIESMNATLKKLEEEVEYSKQHMDLHNFDEHQLSKNIVIYEKELEKAERDLALAEANLLGVFNDPSDRSNHFMLEQQVLHAAVNRSYAWTKLSFHTLKYNLFMHLNEHFSKEKNSLRSDLGSWRNKLSMILVQTKEWKITALKEQDRIRQDYTALIALNERADQKQLRVNQSQRQEVLNVLTTLELLEEEIANTEWMITLLDDNFYQNSSFIVNWWIALMSLLTHIWETSIDLLNFSLFKVSGIPITLMGIFKILSICGSSYWLSLLTRKYMISFGKNNGGISDSTLFSLGELARYFILACGFVVGLISLGLDFSSLIFVIGALMFGISFGLQSLANNFFCGLRILFERKLKIGDEVELYSGHHGKVLEIHVQNTVVLTSDGQKVIVPNSELIGNVLVNWTGQTYDYRRLHIPFAVASGADKELIRKIVIESAKKVPCSLNLPEYSEPQVWLVGFDNHSLQFELVVWINYNCETLTDSKEADYLCAIESTLRQHNIALPTSLHDLFYFRRDPQHG